MCVSVCVCVCVCVCMFWLPLYQQSCLLLSHNIQFRDYFFFVCILRSSHRRFVELYPIVFLSSRLPTTEEWAPFARFPDVFLFLVKVIESCTSVFATVADERSCHFTGCDRKFGKSAQCGRRSGASSVHHVEPRQF